MDSEAYRRQQAAVAAVLKERRFQDGKYGPPGTERCPGNGGHPLAAWLLIIEAELNEAKQAVTHGGMQGVRGRNSVRAEICQIAAVALAALEQHGVEEL